jgi:hypothetical protein
VLAKEHKEKVMIIIKEEITSILIYKRDKELLSNKIMETSINNRIINNNNIKEGNTTNSNNHITSNNNIKTIINSIKCKEVRIINNMELTRDINNNHIRISRINKI